MTNSSAPFVSVLIPAYNEAELIGAVLDSVHESFAALEPVPYEIIVCDNNSTDETAARARDRGATVVFEPHNQIARARNTAARAAQGQWLIFLDGDTFLNSRVLAHTLANFQSGRIGGGGARLQMVSGPWSRGALALVGLWNRVSSGAGLAAGSYVYCPREAWEAIGGFNEKLYASEEIDFSRRLKRWLRQRGLRFEIIREPIITSARKLEWYSHTELAGHVLRVMLPWRLRRREHCTLWYQRPSVKRRPAP